MFQSNAFQAFAFQTVGSGESTTTGGHFLPIYESRGRRKQTLGNVAFIYDKAQELPEDEVQELLEAIEPYIDEEVTHATTIPAFEFIDYAALESNKLAYQKFMDAIDTISDNLALAGRMNKEDDELFQIALICCTIN